LTIILVLFLIVWYSLFYFIFMPGLWWPSLWSHIRRIRTEKEVKR